MANFSQETCFYVCILSNTVRAFRNSVYHWLATKYTNWIGLYLRATFVSRNIVQQCITIGEPTFRLWDLAYTCTFGSKSHLNYWSMFKKWKQILKACGCLCYQCLLWADKKNDRSLRNASFRHLQWKRSRKHTGRRTIQKRDPSIR